MRFRPYSLTVLIKSSCISGTFPRLVVPSPWRALCSVPVRWMRKSPLWSPWSSIGKAITLQQLHYRPCAPPPMQVYQITEQKPNSPLRIWMRTSCSLWTVTLAYTIRRIRFTNFGIFLLHNPSFEWVISTDKLRVTALGTIFDNVSLNKTLSFKAFDNLPGVTISNFQLPADDPAGR
jgi:hypothetical protein